MPSADVLLRTGRSMGEICKASGIDLAALEPFDEPAALIEALRKEDKLIEAVAFLAHALPKREAIWWAWTTAKKAAGDAPPAEIQASLDATGAWITDPTDENRRAAYAAAQVAEMSTAAGCAGAAAFFSGDSMGPADQPPMPPEEFMAAKAISGCLVLVAVEEPEEMNDRLADAVDRGLDVAMRVHLWHAPDAREG